MNWSKFLQQFRWKILVLRILVNAIALSVTVLILPEIYFINPSITSILLVAVVLGVLNALVRPILQFLTIRLLFVSYGLIIVVVNTFILYLLAYLLPTRFAVDSLLWAMVAGFLIGIIANLLENFFGMTVPILPDEDKELRRQVEAQNVGMVEAWVQERKQARAQAKTDDQAALLPEPATSPEQTETSLDAKRVSEPAGEEKIVEAAGKDPTPTPGGEA